MKQTSSRAITCYRIVKKKFSSAVFDGEGAKRYGGRWNNKGQSCVYCASSESLAILEILVHIKSQEILSHYSLFKLEIPETEIVQLDHRSLPINWRSEPAPPETAAIGDQWLKGSAGLVLAVPSAIVSREWNYILNTQHVDYKNLVSTAETLEFEFDQRLL